MPRMRLDHIGQLESLHGVLDVGEVPVTNGSNAHWARDASGRLWVRKRESWTGIEGLLAEAASALIGQALGVRQPKVAVYHDGEEWSWMSQAIPTGEHWAPDMRDLIENPGEVAAMLVLDVLTLNEDRHARNILVEPVGDVSELRLWAIDSGNALIGYPEDYARRRDEPPNPFNHARGLPIEPLADAVAAAAKRATKLPEEQLRGWIEEACVLASETNKDALTSTLLVRCRRAPALAAAYLERLGELR